MRKLLDLNGYREVPGPPGPVNSYKQRRATAYGRPGRSCTNASVPNLYEMLIPASQRSKKFNVGREFDPVKVGIDTSGKSGSCFRYVVAREFKRRTLISERAPRQWSHRPAAD